MTLNIMQSACGGKLENKMRTRIKLIRLDFSNWFQFRFTNTTTSEVETLALSS